MGEVAKNKSCLMYRSKRKGHNVSLADMDPPKTNETYIIGHSSVALYSPPSDRLVNLKAGSIRFPKRFPLQIFLSLSVLGAKKPRCLGANPRTQTKPADLETDRTRISFRALVLSAPDRKARGLG